MTYSTRIRNLEDIFRLEAEDQAAVAAEKEAQRLAAARAATKLGQARKAGAVARKVKALREELQASRRRLAVARQVNRECLISLSKTGEFLSRKGQVEARLREIETIKNRWAGAQNIVEERLDDLTLEQYEGARQALLETQKQANRLQRRLGDAWKEWYDFCRVTLQPIRQDVIRATRDVRVGEQRLRDYQGFGRPKVVTHKPFTGLNKMV